MKPDVANPGEIDAPLNRELPMRQLSIKIGRRYAVSETEVDPPAHFQKIIHQLIEKIEHRAVVATQSRSEPFIMLVLDLANDTAKAIATGFFGPLEVAKVIAQHQEDETGMCLVIDAPDRDVDQLFASWPAWHTLKNVIGKPGMIRIVLVSNDGIMFGSHAIPH